MQCKVDKLDFKEKWERILEREVLVVCLKRQKLMGNWEMLGYRLNGICVRVQKMKGFEKI